MQIDWFTFRETDTFIEQKANVTNNGAFWYAWNFSQQKEQLARKMNCEPPNTLAKYVSLSREMINNKAQWFIYRKVSRSNPERLTPYRCTYRLQSIANLLPYQPRAVQALCSALVARGAAADASDTGLGKTYVALAACRELKVSPGIVCKLAGLDTWKEVCAIFGVVPQFIVNWEHAKGSHFRYVKRTKSPYRKGYDYAWRVPNNTILVFDEAHMANNPGTHNYGLHQAAKGHPSISISATFSDKSAKLRGITNLLGIFTSDEFDVWLQARGYYESRENQFSAVSELDNMRELNRIIFPRYGARLAYTDADVKKYFPESVIQTMVVSLGDKKTNQQNALYSEMIKKANRLREAGKQAESLVAALRYRQATELLKADTLVDLARDLIYQGKSVCVFVNFRETMAYIARALNTRSLVFGDQERLGVSRTKVIKEFQSNRQRLAVLMMEAGGSSISLHDVHGGHQRVSLICPTYRPIELKQVLGRTYRANTKSVPIMKLVYASGTIERRVAETVNLKLDNISALNDGDLMEPDVFNMGVRAEDFAKKETEDVVSESISE
jgi:superfamily II DNA or RNA helicase